jgi:tetratricopeptide (TPR) repeat protein
VKSTRAIEQLLAIVRADPTDMRARLKLGDVYARTGNHPNALEMYEEVGRYYGHEGFMIKAVAVYKGMCQMVVRDAPELRRRYAHVPRILADLYQQLGMLDHAVTALDALGARPASSNHGLS